MVMPSRRLVSANPILLLASVALAFAALNACGGSSNTDEPTPAFVGNRPSPTHGGPVVDLFAQDNHFSTDKINADANKGFSIIFVNNDVAPHNIAIYTNENAEQEIYVGETFTGPGELREYTFTAPEKGTYFFRCDVHPTVMTGEFKVD
jgi:plastocyanin